LRTDGTSVTLRTNGTGITLRTDGTGITLRSNGTGVTLCADRPSVSLGPLNPGRSLSSLSSDSPRRSDWTNWPYKSLRPLSTLSARTGGTLRSYLALNSRRALRTLSTRASRSLSSSGTRRTLYTGCPRGTLRFRHASCPNRSICPLSPNPSLSTLRPIQAAPCHKSLSALTNDVPFGHFKGGLVLTEDAGLCLSNRMGR